MRKPKVRNKYNLTLKDIRNMGIDRTKLNSPLFWRNDVVKAWCISQSIGNSNFCDETTYWLGIYDDESKKIKISFDCHGGMCSYKFEKFYQPKDLECETDLKIQELFLEKIHYLIENGILIRKKMV